MWIRRVDFPAELIDAHRAGRLVIFVGAGASMDAPSLLPSFAKLIEDIATEAHAELTDADWLRPDTFLGRLEDMGVDVHGRIHAHVDIAGSQPNALHEALAHLVSAAPAVRVVTTNYDWHLSTALSRRGVPFEEYVGPALPVGDDFTGVVYLHGKLHGPPSRLIATDKDFGRAYLKDAWAARFLERMFTAYTVLFVGYSLNDLIVSYLTRSLGRGKRRYVLTSEPEKGDWRGLGVEPVGYEVDGRSHAALGEAVAGWAAQASARFLDHRQRVSRLLSAPPSLIPEDESYLESVLADPDRVGLFTEFARGHDWLAWAVKRPQFERVLGPATDEGNVTWALARWFAEHYVMNEDFAGHALELFRGLGAVLGPALCEAIGHELHGFGAPSPLWMRPWLSLLVEHGSTAVPWLERELQSLSWRERSEEALMLFDHLAQPQLRPRRYSIGSPFEISLRGSVDCLDEAWREIFLPCLDEAAVEVLSIVDRHLRHAHRVLADSRVSLGRAAIERHPQDRVRQPLDPLIDAARDSLDALLEAGSPIAAGYLETWARSEVPVLRRLVLYGWTRRNDVDATRKIIWLRERGWLHEVLLRHEVFGLIAVAVAQADEEVADGLVDDAVAGSGDQRPYVLFNVLVWISRHAPELWSARMALQRVREVNPEFEPRDHPDLVRSTSSFRIVEATSTVTVEELHDRIVADVAAAIGELAGDEEMAGLLADTAFTYPEDGRTVLDALDGQHPELIDAVVTGWSRTVTNTVEAEEFLGRLAGIDLSCVVSTLCITLLSDVVEWHLLSAARRLAVDLWNAAPHVVTHSEVDDWAYLALNEPAGQLARFWIHVVAADWRAGEAEWEGLPEELAARLTEMLTVADERAHLVEAVFARDVLFFFEADQQWCLRHLMPLFDWQNPERARRCWQVYFWSGRASEELLAAGVLDHLMTTVRHVGELPGQARSAYFSHVADIALSSSGTPLQWVRRFTSVAEPSQRVEWMDKVTWWLHELPQESVELNWGRWMREYWRGRLDSIPRDLTPGEASAMADWVEFLTESIAEGVELAVARPAAFGRPHGMLYRLGEEKVRRDPAAFAQLIAHRLKTVEPPFTGCRHLMRIVPWLRDGAESVHISEILDEAARLNCGDLQT